jgi:hypothetical protein
MPAASPLDRPDFGSQKQPNSFVNLTSQSAQPAVDTQGVERQIKED